MRAVHNGMPYETCDVCGKPILAVRDGNQILGPYRFTRFGDKRVHCSRECRDGFSWNPGMCRQCKKSLEGRSKSTQFCGAKCKMSYRRRTT